MSFRGRLRFGFQWHALGLGDGARVQAGFRNTNNLSLPNSSGQGDELDWFRERLLSFVSLLLGRSLGSLSFRSLTRIFSGSKLLVTGF